MPCFICLVNLQNSKHTNKRFYAKITKANRAQKYKKGQGWEGFKKY